MAEPRLLTRAALREFLGNIPHTEIYGWIKRGKIPGPLWNLPPEHRNARWDRCAVDRALDAASNLPGSIEAGTAELDRAFGLR
jgi:hypothetical protein